MPTRIPQKFPFAGKFGPSASCTGGVVHVLAYDNVNAAIKSDGSVKTGDLVIGDARVLHASHANDSDAPRTVLTLWYLPQIDKLSQQLRDRVGNLHLYRNEKIYKQWSQQAVDSIHPLLPTLPADYYKPDFQRTARWELQV